MWIVRSAVAATVAAVLILIPAIVIRGAQAGSPAVYDINAMHSTELRPGIQIKPVIGQIGTFVFAEFEPGAETVAHHHTHEQANLGLTGSMTISIGGHSHRLTSLVGTMAPADAEHFIANDGTAKATLLEFQPVRRLDLLPPRPALTFPSSPAAAAVAAGANVSSDFGATAANVAGSRILAGRTCTLSVWRAPATPQGVTLTERAVGAEQFAYVIEGHAEFGAGTDRKQIEPGMLIVNPPGAPAIRLRVMGAGPAVLAIFEPAMAGARQ
jgi:quercetin dioxygenase-like cupin family protein